MLTFVRSEEDELRAQKLEAEILEGRRKRQALKNKGASLSKDMGSLNVSKQRYLHDSNDKASAPTKERVVSTKEQEIRDTIEQLVGKSGTLSVDVNRVTRNFSSSNSDKNQENVGKPSPPVVSAKPRHLSGNYGSPGMLGTSGTGKSPSKPKHDSPILTKKNIALSRTLSSSPSSSIGKSAPSEEAMLTAVNHSPESQSPTRLSRSPTRGGFIQSALLKRQEGTGHNAHGSPPTTPSWKKNTQSATTTPGSLFSSPILLSKPGLTALSPNSATSSLSRSGSGSGLDIVKDETENERAGRGSEPANLRKEDSRLASPERKKTWLESALNRNPSDLRSRSPSPVKAFAERARPKSVLLPGSGGIYSPATPLVSIQRQDSSASKPSQSKDELIYANIAKPSLRDSLSKTPVALSAQTTGSGYIPEAKAWKNSTESSKRWSSIGEKEDATGSEPNWKVSLRHTTSNSMLREEPKFPNDPSALFTGRDLLKRNSTKSEDDLKNEASKSAPNWKTSLKKTTSRDSVRGSSAATSQETPDWKSNLKHSTAIENFSPRVSLVSPTDPFPDLAKPVDKLESKEDLPPALQKLAALKKPPPKPVSSKPTPEALERLKGLRSSSPSKTPVRDEAKEELLKAAGSLKRSNTVKYQPPDELKEAVLATKGTLRRSPTRESKTDTARYAPSPIACSIPEEPLTASVTKEASFQSNLESMLKRGRPGKPQHSPSSPSLRDRALQDSQILGLKKAHTFDIASGTQDTTNKDLKHVTKGRARGPKRRLPTNARGGLSQSVPKPIRSVQQVSTATSSVSSSSVLPSLSENSLNVHKPRVDNANGEKLPPPKPRKPSSSVRAFV